MNEKTAKAYFIGKMSYKERLRRYHQEKDELFRKYRNCSAEELQKKHDELIKKWGI